MTQIQGMSEARRPALAMAETTTGPVVGRVDATTGSTAFLGIPFAEPPRGELRFRPPLPVRTWTEPREAFRYGSCAPQAHHPIDGDQADFGDTYDED
jgi:carboxylesterase type B